MKHIDIAMENIKRDKEKYRDEEHISIIERIVDKTGNPKIAAVLALDLFLVGVDTVMPTELAIMGENNFKNFFLDFSSGYFNDLSTESKP